MTSNKPELVAIHQPNFFPWLGYFNKIARADAFVLLDDAQFPKTGGTWINRVRLRVGGEAKWVTLPIVRAYHGTRRISEMAINNAVNNWRGKLLNSICMNYARAAHFDAVFPLIEDLVNTETDSLLEYNLRALRALVGALGLGAEKLVLASSLAVEGEATERLIAITQALGGTAYLAGGGAAGYQQDALFAAAGLKLIDQDFQHPVYAQGGNQDFVAGLSVLDALLHCGFTGTRTLIGGA